MARRYRTAHLGMGSRGVIHADAFCALADRFELVGLCDLREEPLRNYAREHGLSEDILFTDAEAMLAATRPEVFCFITQPDMSRAHFTALAAKYGVKAIALEKPMAVSLAEASAVLRVCREHGIKGVVSHQQKYLTSLRKVKALVATGAIGEIMHITASCQATLTNLGTHYVDYAMWVNDFTPVEWVVGHIHGNELLTNNHPSPNYVMGQLGFANGVRATVEFGLLSAAHMTPDHYWVDNRLTVYGTRGYAWGETDGRWGALVNGELLLEQGADWDTQQSTQLQPLYLAELADWLDGTIPDHACNLEHAYLGYQILEALCISALDHTRVELPLNSTRHEDIFARMRRELPDCPERQGAVAPV